MGLIDEMLGKQDGEGKEKEKPAVTEEILLEGNVIQLVSFMLCEMEYGVDILAVHEILRYPEITRLPNSPQFIKGVINLRGNIIPVVDMRKWFGFPPGEVTELTRIIVIETSDRQVGLLVDNVYQVVRISENNVDPPKEMIDGISEEFIKGIGRLGDRLIIILNLENILFEKHEIKAGEAKAQ